MLFSVVFSSVEMLVLSNSHVQFFWKWW